MKKISTLCLLIFCQVVFYNTARSQGIIEAAPGPYQLDLRFAGINAQMEVPGEVKLLNDKDGFYIGDGKHFCMEIERTTKSWDELTTAMKKSKTRKFVKYIQEEDYGFIAEMKVANKTEYDFYVYTRLGREYFLVKDSNRCSQRDVAIVKKMFHSALRISAFYFYN